MSARVPQQDRTVVEAQATLRRALERQWRAWSALITELEGEAEAARRASDPEAALFDAPPAPKANLPLAMRKQLLAIFDARLQTTQAEAEAETKRAGLPPPDAEVLRHQLIAHIARELRGEVNEKGLALIYWQNKLVPFDHRALQRATSASDYLAAGFGRRGGGPMQTALVIGGGVLAIGVALYFVVTVLFAPSKPRQASSVTEARVGDTTVTRWDVQGAGSDSGVPLKVDRKRTSYPLVICAPEKQAESLIGAAIQITGTASLREYTIASGGLDLRVVSCEHPEQELARGSIVGSYTTLPAPEGRVRDVWARGPAYDPQRIPKDRMEVTLLVDPTMGEASLVLADGTSLSPSERRPGDTGLELVYLAPLSEVTQTAGLHEQIPGSLPQISPVVLPAPEDRVSYLARVLSVADARVERDGGLLLLRLALKANTDRGEPLGLQLTDIRAMAGSKVVNATWAPLSIQGDGSMQELVIQMPAEGSLVTVSVGTWQASVAP